MSVYFESPYIKITVNSDKSTVQLQWLRFARTEELQEGLNKGLEAVKEMGLRHWIGNLKKMSVIPQKDQDWINGVWFPQLIAAGTLSKMAVVTSDNVFNQMSVDQIMMKANDIIKFDTKYFGSVESAEAWFTE